MLLDFGVAGTYSTFMSTQSKRNSFQSTLPVSLKLPFPRSQISSLLATRNFLLIFRALLPNLHHGDSQISLSVVTTSTAMSSQRMLGRRVEEYEFIELLGQGVFGSVELATTRNGKLVALKRISKLGKRWRAEHARSEYLAGRLLRHPGIVQTHRYFETAFEFVIEMDYLEGMDLIEFMLGRETPLSEKRAKMIFKQLVSSMSYSHSRGIAHRDLKLDNIRITDQDKITIFDFGLCVTNNADKCRGFVGSHQYTAPEVSNNKEYSAFKADVWSSGVVLYSLLCQSFPFNKKGPYGDTSKLCFPKHISKEAKDLISSLLSPSPDLRPTFEEISSHPWFNN